MEPYRVKLADFEGSLDLLLHLVRSAKMDIMTVRLSEITDQYLEYMAQIRETNMDRASDFLETASVLLLIKSRSLLPKPPAPDEENPDPETELRERLKLYEVFRDASKTLLKKEEEGPEYFFRSASELTEEEEESPTLDAEELRRAFVQILNKKTAPRAKKEAPVHIVRTDAFSVRLQKKRLLNFLSKRPSASFESLFDETSEREEIVATFAALLELWGEGRVRLAQKRPFSTIEIRLFKMELLA